MGGEVGNGGGNGGGNGRVLEQIDDVYHVRSEIQLTLLAPKCHERRLEWKCQITRKESIGRSSKSAIWARLGERMGSTSILESV